MGVVKAIETEYAGYRFRSRLEARWAVFLDHLGVQWEYEAQGYETAGGRYLPDFWLPEIGIWAEVKGVMTRPDLAKIMRAIFDLRDYDGATADPRLIILGPVPMPGYAWTHARLSVLKNERIVLNWAYWHKGFPYPIQESMFFGRKTPWETADEESVQYFCNFTTESTVCERLTIDPDVDAAYRAARSARFEYGERG